MDIKKRGFAFDPTTKGYHTPAKRTKASPLILNMSDKYINSKMPYILGHIQKQKSECMLLAFSLLLNVVV